MMEWRKWWKATTRQGTCAWFIRNLVITSLYFVGGWVFFDITLSLGLGTPEDDEWVRLVLLVLYAVTLLVALAAAILAAFNSYKIKKSIKGQWYDTQILTKKDLEYDEPEHEETDGLPVNQDLPRPR